MRATARSGRPPAAAQRARRRFPLPDGVRADARGALGMNGRRVEAHRYTFDRLCIGERCLPPTELRIMDLPVFDANVRRAPPHC